MNRNILSDVAYPHFYESRDGKTKSSFVMSPVRGSQGSGAGLYSIRKDGGTRLKELVSEDELAELFAIDGFSSLGINLRMLPENEYPTSTPGLQPKRRDVKQNTKFFTRVRDVSESIFKNGLSDSLSRKLKGIDIEIPSVSMLRSMLAPMKSIESAVSTNTKESTQSKDHRIDSSLAKASANIAHEFVNAPGADVDAIVKRRLGQGIFRDALEKERGVVCWLSGISNRQLLIASHIVPWSKSSPEQKTAVSNGVLLSVGWDAVFDRGLISFSDDGRILISEKLGATDFALMGLKKDVRLPEAVLTDSRKKNLAWHRQHFGFEK